MMMMMLVPKTYFVVLLCVQVMINAQTPFPPITHPLSIQQQGQILSDVQQHRFRFPQSTNVQPPSSSILTGSNPNDYQSVQFIQSQSPQIITGLNQQQQQPQTAQSQAVLTQQQTLNRPVVQPTLHQQQLINKLRNQQLIRPGTNQFVGGQQHHTQTGFIPLTQNAAQFNAQPALPGSVTDLAKDPLLTAEQSVQLQKYFEEQRQQQRLKELREKQKIVEKHQQFVEKQYEKALLKAKKEHEDFLEKQRDSRQKLYDSFIHTESPISHVSEPNTPRTIAPHESHLFQKALHQYFKENPTTTTTTTTTKSTTTSTEKPRSKKPVISQINSNNFNQQQILEQIRQQLGEDSANSATTKISFLPTVQPKKQYKTLDQQELSQEDILKHLNEHIAKNPLESSNGKNYTSREINLPNGQTIEVIRTSDPNLLAGAKALNAGDSTNIINRITLPPKPTSTLAPPKAILEDLTKSIIPPGADFELIKHTQNGIEKVDGKQLGTGQKQVTFVLLEEQDDGTYKVQGVRGNNDKAKENVDVDSILKKIKNGEIKLPPPSARPATVAPQPQTSTTVHRQQYQSSSTPKGHFIRPTREPSYSSSNTYNQHQTPARSTYYPTPKPTIITSSDAVLNQYQRNSHELESYESQPNSPEVTHVGSSTIQPSSPSSHHTTRYQHSFPTSAIYSTTTQPTTFTKQEPVRSSSASIAAQYYNQNLYKESTTTQLPYTFATHPSTTYASSQDNLVTLQATTSSSTAPQQTTPGLIEILRRNGLYAMAKFLKQSGLDTILNETGPYTIFVPTDKAFRTLLVQLGGPEKAEEKFKENPRLLSGLLLHHVIPGAFEITALQDEMTGVSLAGTQLRVNQYNMHDVEWNEVKITTINGAKILNDKQDIQIPQGIAQAVDRVMFPLPVGDIIQTLQSDRERRFTTFLRALFNSGIAETLQGAKTYTLFAPTETAFEDIPTDDLTRLVTDKELSKELVMRHVMPGTLFTSGMRYYQVKDSLDKSKKITLNKNTGRVKVNNNSIITQNIPATNGVIHAISTLL